MQVPIHLVALLRSVATSEFHLDLDVDPGVVGEEHEIGEGVEAVSHAEVQFVVHGGVRPLVAFAGVGSEVFDVVVKTLVEEGVADLIVRQHVVVVDLVQPQTHGLFVDELLGVEVVEVDGVAQLVEPTSVVDQHLLFALVEQTHLVGVGLVVP